MRSWMCNSAHWCGRRKKNRLCVASAITGAKTRNGSGARGEEKNMVWFLLVWLVQVAADVRNFSLHTAYCSELLGMDLLCTFPYTDLRENLCSGLQFYFKSKTVTVCIVVICKRTQKSVFWLSLSGVNVRSFIRILEQIHCSWGFCLNCWLTVTDT